MHTMTEMLLDAKRQLEKACARVDDQVERVAQVAAVIEKVALQPELGSGTGGRATSPFRTSPAETHALREAARAGALSLAITWNVDGSAAARINDGQPVRLQAKPAALLRIIAAPGGRDAGDGLVGWRSSVEVAAALGKDTGRPTSLRNLTQTIYKLRRAFRDAGQNWFLIQTDRRGSLRFALRVDTALPTDVAGPR